MRRFQVAVRHAALDKSKTEQIKAIKVNALLFESGKRCSIPAHVPERRDWSRYRSKRGAALERPYRKLSVERFRARRAAGPNTSTEYLRPELRSAEERMRRARPSR